MKTAALLTAPQNYALVQLPERNYPGVVVQGDSLHNIVSALSRAQSSLNEEDFQEAGAILEDLLGDLQTVLSGYAEYCQRNKVELPFHSDI